MNSSIQIPSKFKPLFKPARYKVYYGGRYGLKSWNIARALLLLGAKEKKQILCTREFQGSIKDSVHRLLSQQIEELNLGGFYSILKHAITGRNGTEFLFEGIRNNVTSIKSMEGIDICWCEEAENIPEYSWDVLIPTIRKKGSEIWVSFNPFDELDDTYQRFITNPPSTAVVVNTSYRDNPWLSEEIRHEIETLKKNNYNKYLHIYEGQCNSDYEDSIIKPEWVKASIDAHIKLGFSPIGVRSTGFDPADTGSDAKGIASRHGSVVEEVKEWHDGDISEAIDKAFNYAFEYKADTLVYDSIGIGASVKVGLDKRVKGKRIKVEGFCGAESTRNPLSLHEKDRKNKDVFRNLRAQYWWYLRDRFEKTYRAVEKGQYIDPDELISLSSNISEKTLLKLRSELTRVQRKRGQNSFIQVESKEDMLKRQVSSPNMADSLVMCFANKPPMSKMQPLNYPKLNIA